MIHRSSKEIDFDIVKEPGAKQVKIKRLIDTPDGADRFVMSLFHLAPNGSTPPHYHDWEHEIFVLNGSLSLTLSDEGRRLDLRQGDAVFIPRNKPHAFETDENQEAEFIVVAPTQRPPIHNYFLSDDPYEYTPTLHKKDGENLTKGYER